MIWMQVSAGSTQLALKLVRRETFLPLGALCWTDSHFRSVCVCVCVQAWGGGGDVFCLCMWPCFPVCEHVRVCTISLWWGLFSQRDGRIVRINYPQLGSDITHEKREGEKEEWGGNTMRLECTWAESKGSSGDRDEMKASDGSWNQHKRIQSVTHYSFKWSRRCDALAGPSFVLWYNKRVDICSERQRRRGGGEEERRRGGEEERGQTSAAILSGPAVKRRRSPGRLKRVIKPSTARWLPTSYYCALSLSISCPLLQ